jgi:hypothetical protein
MNQAEIVTPAGREKLDLTSLETYPTKEGSFTCVEQVGVRSNEDEPQTVVVKQVVLADDQVQVDNNQPKFRRYSEIMAVIEEIIFYIQRQRSRELSQQNGEVLTRNIFPELVGCTILGIDKEPTSLEDLERLCRLLLEEENRELLESAVPLLIIEHIAGDTLTDLFAPYRNKPDGYPTKELIVLLEDLKEIFTQLYTEGYESFGDPKGQNILKMPNGELKFVDPSHVLASGQEHKPLGVLYAYGIQAVVTTPDKSSPEYRNRGIMTRKHDTYGLAVMVYEWLFGVSLHYSEKPTERIEALRFELDFQRDKYQAGTTPWSLLNKLELVLTNGLAVKQEDRLDPLDFLSQIIEIVKDENFRVPVADDDRNAYFFQ